MTSEVSTSTERTVTSLSSQLKTTVFRYKAQIGHVPKEKETFLFVKRTNPRTRVSKIVPEVVYPIQANRPPVPKHALLEDDWRAYRSVLFNYQSLVWSQMDPVARAMESLRCNRLVSSIYKTLARELQRARPPSDFVPALALYENSVDAPLGYMYRRYKQGCCLSDTPTKTRPRKQELQVPVLLFEGPFMDTVQVSQGPRVKQQWDQEMQYYDADVIVTSNKRPKMYIYNEPDSVALSCERSDFSVPLSRRAQDMAPFSSKQAASLVTEPPPSAPGIPHFPVPELM